MSDQVKYVLDESRLPEAWYNIAADLPEPPPPVLHPGTGQPVGPDDLAPLFPMAIIGQEVSTDRLIAIPEEVRCVYRQWRPTPLYRARRLEQRARDAGAHLLQVRGRLADRLAQAEHRGRAGVLQQAGRREAPDDRDRRGAVGLGARVRRRDLRARGRRLDGEGLVRPEAVPPRADRGVRRPRDREPLRGDERRARDPRRASRLDGIARHGDLGGRRGRRSARGHEVLARLGPQSRPHAPDRDRERGADADGRDRGLPGRHHRLHGRRLELLRPLVPVHRPCAARGGEDPRDRGRAGRLPEPDEGHATRSTSATPDT